MGMLPSCFQIDEMTSGFFLFTSFSISSEATDILTTANKTIHPWGQFRKAASPPWVVFLSVWATVSSGQGSCLASWQALFLVRPHQTLSWGEQRRWWHPFLLFWFSESSLAKASQNTARVGGRGTLLGVKKVTAEASSSLQIYSGCVHFFMSSVYTESGPCFDSGRTPAVASPLVSLNPLLSPPNSSQNYILKMQILFFTSQDSKIFFFLMKWLLVHKTFKELLKNNSNSNFLPL